MLTKLVKKIFGSRNERLIKKYSKIVKQINALEEGLLHLTDETLKNKTQEFKKRLQQGQTVDQLLVEAFAVCREASRRVMNMRHFDVQLIGGIALHQGKIAEMRTGEGKTLVATLAVYLNALSGDGVHVVTVNEYLAQRDSAWMGKLFNFLGLTVGVNLPSLSSEEKKQAYACDITYSTNNELGFDYLRDNMVYNLKQKVQRLHHFAVIDEVDSILIDEARTPLIISGMAEDHTHLYAQINKLPAMLIEQIGEEKSDGTGVERPGDYTKDEKNKQIFLTEQGHERAELILQEWGLLKNGESLYAAQNISLMHHIYAAMKAHHFFLRDQQYVVQQGEVVIVDEFTGRLMAGRRWSDGLHQAVEAKEGVAIQPENQTLASITFQNYFRMYPKLAGMTGTADTEAYEFQEIYSLETVVIPTNRPIQRKDLQDQIFKDKEARNKAVLSDIKSCYERGQPALVGTASIEMSEYLSELLAQESLPHQVLNAKQHEKEAEIIAQAGKTKMITIATNMAGRGTDIVLGGNIEKQIHDIQQDVNLNAQQKTQMVKTLKDDWQDQHQMVKDLGGLHIIGTERHESRRIDNQLRGRAGRQGDRGSSRFYLSLEDDLMRIFGGDRLKMLLSKFKALSDEAIEAPLVSRTIEGAQRKVEARNFDVRKQLLQFDDVANEQRQEIYALRNDVLHEDDISNMISGLLEDVVTGLVYDYVPPQSLEEQWRIPELQDVLLNDWDIDLDLVKHINDATSISDEDVLKLVLNKAKEQYIYKKSLVNYETFAEFEKNMFLSSLDQHWRDHLSNLEHLRQGIYLRGYAQKDPKQEYKKESYELFNQLLVDIKQYIIKNLLNVQIQSDVAQDADPSMLSTQGYHNFADQQSLLVNQNGIDENSDGSDPNRTTYQNMQLAGDFEMLDNIPKVGRNEPCPCGSGLKYKNCHGKIA
jgi:preprotein translocase subunit SecA